MIVETSFELLFTRGQCYIAAKASLYNKLSYM